MMELLELSTASPIVSDLYGAYLDLLQAVCETAGSQRQELGGQLVEQLEVRGGLYCFSIVMGI